MQPDFVPVIGIDSDPIELAKQHARERAASAIAAQRQAAELAAYDEAKVRAAELEAYAEVALRAGEFAVEQAAA